MVNNDDLFPVLSAEETTALHKKEGKWSQYKTPFLETLEKLEVGGSTWVSKGVLSYQTILNYCKDVANKAFIIRKVKLKKEFQGFRVIRTA